MYLNPLTDLFHCSLKISLVMTSSWHTGWFCVFQGDATCSACPSGYECVSDPDIPAVCSSGYYSLSAVATCTICPSGSMCPFTFQNPVQCSAGKHTGGNTGAISCTDCTAGYECPDPRYNTVKLLHTQITHCLNPLYTLHVMWS